MKKRKKKNFALWTVSIISLLLLIDLGITYYFYSVAYIRNDDPVGQVQASSKNYPLVTQFDKLNKKNAYHRKWWLKTQRLVHSCRT